MEVPVFFRSFSLRLEDFEKLKGVKYLRFLAGGEKGVGRMLQLLETVICGSGGGGRSWDGRGWRSATRRRRRR